MRTAPLFCLEAASCRVWPRVLRSLWLATGAVLAGWLLLSGLRHDLDKLRASAAAAAAVAWWLARPLKPLARIAIAWDGRGWQWGTAAATPTTSGELQPCELRIAIDLGGWLLLRLQPIAEGPTSWRRPVHWVALAESEASSNWHSLRCALYSARRMTDPVPSLTPPPPAEDRPPPR